MKHASQKNLEYVLKCIAVITMVAVVLPVTVFAQATSTSVDNIPYNPAPATAATSTDNIPYNPATNVTASTPTTPQTATPSTDNNLPPSDPTEPHITPTGSDQTLTSYTANYTFAGRVRSKIKLYAWIANDKGNWVERSLLAATVPAAQTPVTQQISVTFDFNNLGLANGKDYSYFIADGTTNSATFYSGATFFTVGDVQSTTTHNTNTNPHTSSTASPSTSVNAQNYVGGVSIDFPPDQQTITKTSAALKARISVKIAMPINLVYMWGATGSPLGSEETLYDQENPPMTTSQWETVPINLNGLTAGTSYQFAIKNKITNITSAPLMFTTATASGAASVLTYAGAVFPYSPSTGGMQAPVSTSGNQGVLSQLVPLCGRTPGPGIPASQTNACGFKDFLQMISNVIQFMLIIMVPIIAGLIMYSGFIIIWLGKIPDPTSEQSAMLRRAKGTLVRIAIGVTIILLAYTLIATILRELDVKPAYVLLNIFTSL